jgi:hypothetical protein
MEPMCGFFIPVLLEIQRTNKVRREREEEESLLVNIEYEW